MKTELKLFFQKDGNFELILRKFVKLEERADATCGLTRLNQNRYNAMSLLENGNLLANASQFLKWPEEPQSF